MVKRVQNSVAVPFTAPIVSEHRFFGGFKGLARFLVRRFTEVHVSNNTRQAISKLESHETRTFALGITSNSMAGAVAGKDEYGCSNLYSYIASSLA